jgi:hypothetical protein
VTDASDGRWTHLSRSDLIALGRTTVTHLFEGIGCSVSAPESHSENRLDVQTPSGRRLDVYVSTQHLGGYAFWTKRRLEPAADRYAAVVLLADASEPEVYLVPTTDLLGGVAPLKNRDNVGKQSEPEFGISLARSSLPALERYRWDAMTSGEDFR